MTRQCRHQEMDWQHVWGRVRSALERRKAPAGVVAASQDGRIRCEVRNGVLYLHVPPVLRDYIEHNMDCFKPILWPFIKFHKCNKLIYKPFQNTDNHGKNE